MSGKHWICYSLSGFVSCFMVIPMFDRFVEISMFCRFMEISMFYCFMEIPMFGGHRIRSFYVLRMSSTRAHHHT